MPPLSDDLHPSDTGTPLRPEIPSPEVRAIWLEIIREAFRLELGASRPRLVTIEDAASILSVSPRQVANFAKRGELAARYVGTSLRFSIEAVEAFMRALPRTSKRSTPTRRKGAERAA